MIVVKIEVPGDERKDANAVISSPESLAKGALEMSAPVARVRRDAGNLLWLYDGEATFEAVAARATEATGRLLDNDLDFVATEACPRRVTEAEPSATARVALRSDAAALLCALVASTDMLVEG